MKHKPRSLLNHFLRIV